MKTTDLIGIAIIAVFVLFQFLNVIAPIWVSVLLAVVVGTVWLILKASNSSNTTNSSPSDSEE